MFHPDNSSQASVLIHIYKRGGGGTNRYNLSVVTKLVSGGILGPKPRSSSVQLLSHVRLFENPWTAARQASLSITSPRSLLKLCPLSQGCHPTISSSIIPFSCPQSLPASGSFPMSWLFESGGQSIGVSSSTSVLPVNIQN